MFEAHYIKWLSRPKLLSSSGRLVNLTKLRAHGASRKLDSVAISEEAGGVCNNLADVEASTVVSTSSVVGTSDEGSGQAAVGDTAAVRSPGVREGNARWASLALLGLVDVGCGPSR